MIDRVATTVLFTDRPEVALEAAYQHLVSEPVVHNLVLSLLQARARHFEPGRYWVATQDGLPRGVVFQSPEHFPAAITPMADEVVDAVVSDVVETGVMLPGVVGEARTAARFAGQWTEWHAAAASPSDGQRIYELIRLIPPPDVPGHLRQADADDRDLIVEWMHGFDSDTGEHSNAEAIAGRRIAAGNFWLWDDHGPKSMAAHTEPAEGVVRVQAVYTPPEHRNRGHSGACVSALSARLLDRGLRCMLYTDLGNPVSNSLYRRLGYRAVAEGLRYDFTYRSDAQSPPAPHARSSDVVRSVAMHETPPVTEDPLFPGSVPRPADRWRETLLRSAVPEAILDNAPEPEVSLEPERFRWRPQEDATQPVRPSRRRALEALPDGGTVLDVGVGGGASSLGLAPKVGLIVGVDPMPGMLESFEASAREAGVEVRAVLGSWPDVADEVEPADVAVCHHALYRVAELEDFVSALTVRARHRVVVEVSAHSPLAGLNPLWKTIHGIDRPDPVVADELEAVLTSMGLAAEREDIVLPPRVQEVTPQLVTFARRRLYVGPERDAEIEQFLREREPQEQRVAVLWWPGSAA